MCQVKEPNFFNTDMPTFFLLIIFSYNAMQIPVGWLLDRYGVRFCLAGAVLLTTLGVFLFSDAYSFYSAFSARVLMGLGSSFVFYPCCYYYLVGSLRNILDSCWGGAIFRDY